MVVDEKELELLLGFLQVKLFRRLGLFLAQIYKRCATIGEKKISDLSVLLLSIVHVSDT